MISESWAGNVAQRLLLMTSLYSRNALRVSCTLEAGVKIYSLRVDSVHSEAYEVLGGINRVGQENEQGTYPDPILEDADVNNEQEENDSKKEQGRKLSLLSTLEPSFNAINVKKFDVAFVVDPLYHQTSAQFDEGGAKGLLLNNLGVYADCHVLFDSMEVPGKCMSTMSQCEGAETIDLSFARECIEQMVLNMSNDMEISPGLGAILNQFDKDEQIPYDLKSSEQGDVSVKFHDLQEDDRFGEVDGYLFLSLGFSTKQNAWSGPNHWKYQKVKDPKDPAEEIGSPKAKKMKNKKAETDLDFSRAIDTDISIIFDAPKNPKSLLLPANRAPCNTKLPEDCHYQPEDLVKLFLLPNVLCLGKGGRRRKDEDIRHRDDFGETKFWDDDGGGFDGAFDDGHSSSDFEESSTLISQPRQVNKIEVQYDKTSKQVDVHVLKETLCDHIQKLNQTSVQAGTLFVSEVRTARQVKQSMSEFPRERIRQVQISTRSAAGLPGYDPKDPTLPALPSLSAAIAALEPSPPHLRCKQCKGRLLRGLQSNICVYCGSHCQNNAVPDPICFTSTIGYKWLLRSLGLDGSEMVKPSTSKNEQDQGQSSPKAELPLSDFINFRIAWAAEIEKQETSIFDKQLEETKRSWSRTGLAADNFFFKSTKAETTGTKAVARLDNQNLSTEPADGSAMGKTTESFSEWQADFQFAISDNQDGVTKSSVHFMGSSDGPVNKIQDSQASHFASSEVDLSAHMDSVFGHKKDLTDGRPMDNSVASQSSGDWDPDDLWTNMGRNESHLVGGSDAAVSPKDRFGNLDNLSTGADLFQYFQWQTNKIDVPENKTMDVEHKTMDESQTVGDFDATLSAEDDLTPEISNNLSTSDNDLFQDFQWDNNGADITSIKTVNEKPSTNNQSQLVEGSFATVNVKDDTFENSNGHSTNVDLFQDFQWQTFKSEMSENKRMHEENNTIYGGAVDEWNDFTGSARLQDPSQNAWIQSDHLSTPHRNSNDIDLFSPNSTFDERDIDGFSEPNLFSTSNVNKSSAAENVISSKPSLTSRLSGTGGPSSDPASAANYSNDNGKSTNSEEDVKILISQIHDLSFMLRTDLCIPSSSDSQNSATQD